VPQRDRLANRGCPKRGKEEFKLCSNIRRCTCQHSKVTIPRTSTDVYVCPVASAALATCLIQATRRKSRRSQALIWCKRHPRRRSCDDQETRQKQAFRLEPRLSTDRRQLRLRGLASLIIMTCVLSARRAADLAVAVTPRRPSSTPADAHEESFGIGVASQSARVA
jgi:hypothetical protein